MKYLRFSCNTSKNIQQSGNEETAKLMMGTIFSPSFHISKHAGGEITNGGRLLELVYQLITFLTTFTSSNINKSTNTANINRPRNIKLA